MNLGQYIASQLLEADEQTIALFPGAFKPPTIGHFDCVKQLLKKSDQVVILISPNPREGITAEQSINIWNEYKKLIKGTVEVRITPESPITEAYKVVKNNPDVKFILALGRGDAERFKNMKKYSNIEIYDGGGLEGVSATLLRKALNSNNKEEIKKYIPKEINVDDYIKLLNKKESSLDESTIRDSYQDYILQNRNKIEKAAAFFNLRIPEMENAFISGKETVLSDDIWKNLENSKSYRIKTLDDAIQYSLKRGIDPKPYIDSIKEGKELPLPLVLCYSQDKYYLVGGDIILSLYRALGSIPTVLQGNLNIKLNENIEGSKYNKLDIIKKFIKFCIRKLELKNLPSKLSLSNDTERAKNEHTFGNFNLNNNKIWLYTENRNMADILRTLGHELVHFKQKEEGRIKNDSGKTGSDIENEANSLAGILLREFGEQNREIYEGLIREGLIDHAQKELELAGLFSKESDYGGMIGNAVFELCKTFSKQGHSGFSSSWVREIFNKLSNFENLTPINNSPDEWMDINELCGEKPNELWQNKRNPAIFSKDGGKTWYNVNDKTIKEGIMIGISKYKNLIKEDALFIL